MSILENISIDIANNATQIDSIDDVRENIACDSIIIGGVGESAGKNVQNETVTGSIDKNAGENKTCSQVTCNASMAQMYENIDINVAPDEIVMSSIDKNLREKVVTDAVVINCIVENSGENVEPGLNLMDNIEENVCEIIEADSNVLNDDLVWYENDNIKKISNIDFDEKCIKREETIRELLEKVKHLESQIKSENSGWDSGVRLVEKMNKNVETIELTNSDDECLEYILKSPNKIPEKNRKYLFPI